ncbi:MAG: NAD(P)H:quinone oxidoreductase [Sphingomonadales bacterium]|nr:NAD(P)H:quinone oxidoreductase [Sphingomonadales bacterium]PIX64695.1 MAG: NAD(P)H:quinone oxidoreductase [Sphingomonadales bacterium CG_4_10_14_3_um_filter_58_15]NCO48441.1 NAD(P)H:quinone oxidoreductase [Sphingomonadales bacterium]NCO99257.1 NAD(P)H:quinone oxidoreductase [Sphingomonadales bacterium]NCP27705.1 NAD(P)H:quinone oxidoreductase [Sphingomonadales bacterium]
MAKILVLYYSSYGHVDALAQAIAEGASEAGGEVTIGRVPETAPAEVVEAAGFSSNDDHPVIEPDQLADYDAIIVGSPTRFGRMSSQMASFWDRTGGLWMNGSLVGKVGASFTSTAVQHGGQETTQFSILTNLLHQGMTIVGLDYGFQGQMSNDAIVGGSPYGASTVAGGDGSRTPHEIDLAGAKYLGAKVARTAAKLIA